jgi:IclR family acetate operon transcriptional repressor
VIEVPKQSSSHRLLDASETPRPAEAGPPMQSVDNALQIVLLLRTQESVRVSDVAEQLGVSVSTAHRLLSALVHRDFAEKDPMTHAYSRGSALRAGSEVDDSVDLVGATRPYLELLSRELGETIQLQVLRGRNVKFIGASESAKALRTASRVGFSMPAHCSSGGKVLLAALDPEELRVLFREPQLPSRTQDSIATRAQLEFELAKVRRVGYALSIGEGEADVAAVAVAIYDSTGQQLAAIAASGPRSRMSRKHMVSISTRLAWAARQIAGGL